MKIRKSFIGFLTVLAVSVFLGTSVMAATVCKIGSKKYDNLQQALDAVKNGQTITMTKPVTTDGCYGIDRKLDFTIDFAGLEYNGTYNKAPSFFFMQNGLVTLKNLNMNVNGFEIGENASVLITGGTYTGRGIIYNNGSLRINKGTFTRKNGKEPVQFIWTGKKGVTKIKGGVFKGTKKTTSTVGFLTNSGRLTISGGTFRTYSQSIIDNFGKVTISGGKLTADNPGSFCIFNRQGTTLTITDGTFSTPGTVITSRVINPEENGLKAANISISGGTFNSLSNKPVLEVSGDPMYVEISKGTFKGGPIFIMNGAVCKITGGKSDNCVITQAKGKVTIVRFTVTQDTPSRNPEGKVTAILQNQGGTFIVKGGSFTSKKGYGYSGPVKFKITDWKKLFDVKRLER